MKKTSQHRGGQAGLAGIAGSAPSFRVKAWAVVDDETGRLMLSWHGRVPLIYMTREAARLHSGDGDRLVRIEITEIEK